MEKTDSVTVDADVRLTSSEFAASRSRVYLLLSALFMKEVTTDLLATLNSEEMVEVFGALGSDIGSSLGAPEPKRLVEDLAEEYAALFLVPGGIPPYESVRLHGMLDQKPAWEAEEFYGRCGFVIRDSSGIFPDHFGMQMEFMSCLAGRETTALINNNEEEAAKWTDLQKEFFCKHIDTWAFVFLGDVEKYALHPLYKEIGALAINFLRVEKDEFMVGMRDSENTVAQSDPMTVT